MEWLLGGVTATGIAGVVVLGIYLAKMAGDNRNDLHLLIQSEKDLANARRDIFAHATAIEDRDNAIQSLQEQIVHERAANEAARDALASARKRLAARGDASSVAHDLNSALSRLSEMSAVSSAGTTEGGDD